VAGVKRELDPAVIGERGGCDLDQEQDVGGGWRLAGLIPVGAGAEQGDVRLWLVIAVEADGASN
jgi:hypothetical protein